MKFSIATNCCAGDELRIRHTIPSWLRVFGNRVKEVLVVVDGIPPTGRIAVLHNSAKSDIAKVYNTLDELQSSDSRVGFIPFPDCANQLRLISDKWFKRGMPVRCQAGTPILAFLYGIENCHSKMVLRVDCDMLFYDCGWLDRAVELLQSDSADIIEPPRLGLDNGGLTATVSSRAFFLHPSNFADRLLPMKAYCLDPLRLIHRHMLRRPTWLALEQMLQVEKLAGKLRHVILDQRLGFSIHIPTRSDVSIPGFQKVVSSVESGTIPSLQKILGWNFAREAWQ